VTIFLFLGIFSCITPYQIENFKDITDSHQTVAILPFDILNTGVIPKDLTDEDLYELEIAEGHAFQISFFNEVLGSTRRGKKNLRVDIQPIAQTNRVLREHDLLVIEVLDKPYDEVCEMLKVDVVLVGQIEKNRIMSDLASYGIEVGVHIVNVLSSHSLWQFFSGDLSKSKEIKTMYTLYDKIDGKVLWSVSYVINADWRQKANDIIDETNRRAARKFPYRANK
jgi:hypothetical protein